MRPSASNSSCPETLCPMKGAKARPASRSGAGLAWLARLSLAGPALLSACGDDSPAPRSQDTGLGSLAISSAPDYVPSLGIPGLGTEFGPGQGDWQPSFAETPTHGAPNPDSGGTGGTSSANPSSTSSEASDSAETTSTSDAATSDTGSGSSTSESGSESGPESTSSSGDTSSSSSTPDTGSTQSSPETSTTDPSSTDTSSETSTLDPDSTGTESGSEDSSNTGSESSGEPTDDTDTAPPPLDPQGPQFGLRLDLELRGPAFAPGNYRAMIFEFQAQRSTQETPRAQPEASDLFVHPLQPRLSFTPSGKASLILRTPTPSRLDPETGRSKPHAVAIYLDRNDDGAWSPNEVFVAVLPNSLVYEQANGEHPERWRSTQAGFEGVQELLDPEPALTELPAHFELARLDANRPPVRIGGLFEQVLHRGVDFLALVSRAEYRALASNFWSGPRPADIFLRGEDAPGWELEAQGLPAGSRRELPLVEIPGIKPEFTATNWLVGYRRPVGAPLEAPDKFLTPDSELIAQVMGSGPIIGFWIQEGAWASSPLGALYAGWYSLGAGWGFVDVNAQNAPFYYYPQPSLLTSLGVREP